MRTNEHRPPPRPAATVVVAILGLALMAVALGSFDYMVEAMRLDLGFTPEDANAALVLPEIGCLVVVFVAGALGDTVGRRRVLVAGALAFVLGGALVAVAPSLLLVVAGRVFEGMGGTITAIVALALLSDAFPSGRARAMAFAASAAVTPAVWIVAPLVGAWVTEAGHWRLAAVLWAVAGLVTAAAAWVLMPRDPAPRRTELVTPILGGVVLAGVVAAVTSGTMGGRVLLVSALAVVVVALVILVVLMRRPGPHGLDLRVPRTRAGLFTILAVVVANTVNLAFFAALLLQYRNDFDVVTVALLLIPLQVGGTLGGLGGGPVMARIGVVPAGVLLLALSGATALLAFLVHPDSAPWVLVVTVAMFAAADSANSGPLTAQMMDAAARDGEGAAAAHREAASSLGGAIGAVLAGLIVFGGFQTSLQGELQARGVRPALAAHVAEQVTAGAGAAEVARTVDAPPAGIRALMGPDPPLLSNLQVSSYHDAALVTAITYGLATILFAFSGGIWLRRRSRAP